MKKPKPLNFRCKVGGPVATALVTVARLGGKTTFLGRIGDDANGKFLLNEFATEGVNISGLIMDQSRPTNQAFIWIDQPSGKKSVVLNNKNYRPVSAAKINLDHVKSAKYLLIDGRDTETTVKLIEWAKEKGTNFLKNLTEGDLSMKRFSGLIFIITMLLITVNTQAQLKLKQGDEIFVKESTENLRLSPGGSVICQLPQGTRLIAIEEDANWVAVHLVGYIWKKSLTQSRFDIPGFTMRALHIMVATEQEANEIKKLLDQGGDFKELAKQRSKDPNAAKGGDLGLITKGDLLPELDKAISSLNVGQISDVIKTDLGYHIFKRTE